MIRRYKKNSFSHPISTIKSSDLAFTPYTIHRYVQIKQKPYNIEKEKHIVEPYPLCAHCGKKISHISEAFVSKDGNGYLHFDCAKEIAKDSLKPQDDEKISYIGNGKFASIKIINDSLKFNSGNTRDSRNFRSSRDLRDSREMKDFRVFEFEIKNEFQIESKEAFDKFYKTVEDAKK